MLRLNPGLARQVLYQLSYILRPLKTRFLTVLTTLLLISSLIHLQTESSSCALYVQLLFREGTMITRPSSLEWHCPLPRVPYKTSSWQSWEWPAGSKGLSPGALPFPHVLSPSASQTCPSSYWGKTCQERSMGRLGWCGGLSEVDPQRLAYLHR